MVKLGEFFLDGVLESVEEYMHAQFHEALICLSAMAVCLSHFVYFQLFWTQTHLDGLAWAEFDFLGSGPEGDEVL